MVTVSFMVSRVRNSWRASSTAQKNTAAWSKDLNPKVGPAPGVGRVDGSIHVRDGQGFILLFNPNPVRAVEDLPTWCDHMLAGTTRDSDGAPGDAGVVVTIYAEYDNRMGREYR